MATINATVTMADFRPNYDAILAYGKGHGNVADWANVYLAVAAVKLGDIRWTENRGGSYEGYTKFSEARKAEGHTVPSASSFTKIARVMRHYMPNCADMTNEEVTSSVRVLMAEFGTVSDAYESVPTAGGKAKAKAKRGPKGAEELMGTTARAAVAEGMSEDDFLALALAAFRKADAQGE